jgi:DNA-3-methyladenine glycosylase II
VLVDQAAFDRALDALLAHDPDTVGVLIETAGRPALRQRAAGFEGLAWIVVAQQLSTASATAIFGRLKERLQAVEAHAIRLASDETLRGCGLSAGKIRTLRAVSDAVDPGLLDFGRLGDVPADEAHAALVTLKGIGPWTADIFLLFCLGHPDAWPAGDLALQEACKRLLGLDARPSEKALRAIGERWRPWRGVAAQLLWAYYHVVIGRAGIG